MKLIALLLASLSMLQGAALAQDRFVSIELSDAELAQLRGRYTLPDRIISFGLTMSSSWQDSAGQVIGASLALQLGHAQVQPLLSVTPIDQAGTGTRAATSTGSITGGAGLQSIQGLTQSLRTAGDFNQGLNDLSIEFTQDKPAAAQASGLPWVNGQGFSNPAGTVRAMAVDGGLHLVLQASHDQGFAQQQIGARGVAQHATILGAFNRVYNTTRLQIALRDSLNPGLGAAAMPTLEVLRPAGY
ncbi:MAG: hypothetical protein V4812_13365 [Pseudomonadota bacterium]